MRGAWVANISNTCTCKYVANRPPLQKAKNNGDSKMISTKLYSYWLSLGTDGQSYRHARWFSLVHVQNRLREFNSWLRWTIQHWSTPSPTGRRKCVQLRRSPTQLPSASWSARGEPFTQSYLNVFWWLQDIYNDGRRVLCAWVRHGLPLAMPAQLLKQILLLLSTTVSEACWTTVTHAWHEKENGQVFMEQDQKTITGPLWTTTPRLSPISELDRNLWPIVCGRCHPLTICKASRAWDTKKQTNQTNEKRLTLSAITSVPFEIMKTTSPHSTQKKPRVQSCFASLLITRLELVAHLRFHSNQWRLRPHTSGAKPTWGVNPTTVKFPASSRAAFKVSSLLFKHRISVKCYLSIVSHIPKNCCRRRNVLAKLRIRISSNWFHHIASDVRWNKSSQSKEVPDTHIHKRTKQRHIFQIDINSPNGDLTCGPMWPLTKAARERNQMVWLRSTLLKEPHNRHR